LNSKNTLEYIFKKDRLIVMSGLFAIRMLVWLYIIYLYKQMGHKSGVAGGRPANNFGPYESLKSLAT